MIHLKRMPDSGKQKTDIAGTVASTTESELDAESEKTSEGVLG